MLGRAWNGLQPLQSIGGTVNVVTGIFRHECFTCWLHRPQQWICITRFNTEGRKLVLYEWELRVWDLYYILSQLWCIVVMDSPAMGIAGKETMQWCTSMQTEMLSEYVYRCHWLYGQYAVKLVKHVLIMLYFDSSELLQFAANNSLLVFTDNIWENPRKNHGARP